MTKNILLLGSGLMSETVVNYLNKREDNFVMIASNILPEAQKIAQKYQRTSAHQVDVTKADELDKLVSQSDIVISYVPWIFHKSVAESCLRNNKNMVTASYISPVLRSFDKEVQKKGLIFLNEVGVDPGIDHIATMKIVDECYERGDKIISYESMCGGLPSPEFCDNPLGYKFTWSPIGAFLALKNDAKYLENGKVVEVLGEELLYHAKPIDINMALSLEGYPNRDSTQYKELYNLKDVQSLRRGTLRFQGFSQLINCFKSLGFFDNDNKIELKCENWMEMISLIVQKDKPEPKLYQKVFESLGLKNNIHIYASILHRTLSHPFYKKKSQEERDQIGIRVLSGLARLGFFDSSNKINRDQTYLQNLVSHLEKNLSLKQGETDLLVMQHKFLIEQKSGNRYKIKSTLIKIGEKNGYSAMSVLVGYPTAIATQLILDGAIKSKGVVMPNKKEIYLPIFNELEKNGIKCVEEYEGIQNPHPKL